MIVCLCNRVSDREIRQAAANGARSLQCLQLELGVATRCGRCAGCAHQVLSDALGPGAPRTVTPLHGIRSPQPA